MAKFHVSTNWLWRLKDWLHAYIKLRPYILISCTWMAKFHVSTNWLWRLKDWLHAYIKLRPYILISCTWMAKFHVSTNWLWRLKDWLHAYIKLRPYILNPLLWDKQFICDSLKLVLICLTDSWFTSKTLRTKRLWFFETGRENTDKQTTVTGGQVQR